MYNKIKSTFLEYYKCVHEHTCSEYYTAVWNSEQTKFVQNFIFENLILQQFCSAKFIK